METQVPAVNNPRAMPIGRGAGWLLEGFGYFKKNPLAWIGIIILLVVLTFVIMLIPIIGGLAFNLLMPVFMGGLLLGCQAQAQGGEITVNHLFAGFSKNTVQLVVIGLLYMLGFIVISVIVVVLIITMFGGMAMLQEMQSGDPEMVSQHARIILLLVLVATALYLPLLMAYWFAPALVILADVSPLTAMKMSFMGCLYNVLPFTLYGIVGVILSIIAAIPLGLGFLIFAPMAIASVYISYREVYNVT